MINRRRIIMILAVIGPGIITASADNDAGGIGVYSIAGAREGYSILWLLLLSTFVLAIVQEMAARTGVVTGKGLADLIRERFGIKITLFSMILLIIGNLTVTISEFAGIAASMEIFGISRYMSIPISAIFIWFMVFKGNYNRVEKIFLILSSIYFTYVISGFMAKPSWGDVVKGTFVPSFKLTPGYITLFIAIVGTTITPWMQFFLQSIVVDKMVDIKDYKYTKFDVYFGSFITDFVAFFIIISTASTLHIHGIDLNSAEEAALALKPFAGKYCALLFSIGLLNASFMGASILPLSTAYAVSEAFGWESGIDRDFKEAPQFLTIYTGLIIIGGSFILIPNINLMNIMLVSQTINGILLIFTLTIMLKLINDRSIMGEYVNSRGRNIITIITITVLSILTILLIISGCLI
jgi:Mn2+/Fe2+ NRAMP family transporter